MDFQKTILTLAAACALVSHPALLPAQEAMPVVKSVKVLRTADNGIAVEIAADRKVEYTAYKMPDLQRIVVDLPGTEPLEPAKVQRYKSIPVSHLWIEKRNINDVPLSRVSIYLAEDADYEVKADPTDAAKVTLFLAKRPAVTSPKVSGEPPGKGMDPAPPAASTAPASTTAQNLPASAPPEHRRAVRVTGVRLEGEAIEIQAAPAIAGFETFTLSGPGRLVIEIPGAQSTLGSLILPGNRLGISKARFGTADKSLRIVFDSTKEPFPAHEVVKTATGLRVVAK